MHKTWMKEPTMKVGLILVLINFLPKLLPIMDNIPYIDIVTKFCLVIGLIFILFTMFKRKTKY